MKVQGFSLDIQLLWKIGNRGQLPWRTGMGTETICGHPISRGEYRKLLRELYQKGLIKKQVIKYPAPKTSHGLDPRKSLVVYKPSPQGLKLLESLGLETHPS